MNAEANQVAPRLYVGSKPAPGRHEGFDTIVLNALEYQPPAHLFPGSEIIHSPIDDALSRPMTEQEIAAATKTGARVARRLLAGRCVLSTCQMGLNRSSLVAAIAMHDAYGMGVDEIISRIRRARGPWALSNPNFEQLLRVVAAVKRAG